MSQNWTVYILRCADGTFYTGITNDLARRLEQHESGKGAKYTKGRGPYEILLAEPHPDKGSALKRELEIKALSREEKLRLVCAQEAGRRSPVR